MSDRMSESMSDRMSEPMSDRRFGFLPDRISEFMPDTVSENLMVGIPRSEAILVFKKSLFTASALMSLDLFLSHRFKSLSCSGILCPSPSKVSWGWFVETDSSTQTSWSENLIQNRTLPGHFWEHTTPPAPTHDETFSSFNFVYNWQTNVVRSPPHPWRDLPMPEKDWTCSNS